MRVLLLCEGDAETWDSWSGTSRMLVRALRAAGVEVLCGNVELAGRDRWLVAAQSFSPQRQRWWVRFHLGDAAFAARSRRAAALLAAHRGRFDVVLQIGATFRLAAAPAPVTMFCDSSIAIAEQGMRTGVSEAAQLRSVERQRVTAREARVYQQSRLIFTMSDMLRGSMLQDFQMPPDRVLTVHGGPNFDLNGSAPEPSPARRSDVILFVGRAFDRKGGGLLVRAFRELRMRRATASLLIVGPTERPRDLDGVDGIEFLGFLDKRNARDAERLADAYARAGVFCLPTRFEPFGVAYLEAMHHALPCVGPAAWAVPEIIAHEQTGLVVAPDDPSALVAALARLMDDPDGARDMGLAGRARLRQHFTWPNTARRMIDAWREIT